MEEKQKTPEKQLLNLIEKPQSQGTLRTATIKYQGLSFFSFAALKGRLAFLKGRFAKDSGPYRIDTEAVNAILKVGVLVLAVYLAFSLTVSIINQNKELKFELSPDELKSGQTLKEGSYFKAISYYLEKARERDIFSMERKKKSAEGPSEGVLEATKSLKLVGISWSGDPDAMIENSKTQKTYFVKKGKTIEGGIKIEAIFKDKVVLSYEGEEVELK